jgi:diguanylate cyclase (GGDEF)-like protein/PAS domain S-box-containing protein
MQLVDALEKIGIHSSYRIAMSNMVQFLFALAFIQLVACFLPAWPNIKGVPNYIPIHDILETISIVVSMMVFAVGWNLQDKNQSGNVVLLACVFFSVGLLDFSHTVSYVGHPEFFSPNDSQKHLNFWLTSRFISAVILLVIVIREWKPLTSWKTRYTIFISLLITVLLFNWAVIYHQNWFPDTFIPGRGLTQFKKNLEYIIILINLLTAVIMLVKMSRPQPYKIVMLFGAVCVLAMSEFYFTIYTTMLGSYNILGHIYKVIAYLFIYRAIVVETIEEPYLKMMESEERLKLATQAGVIGIWDWNIVNNELRWDESMYKLYGLQSGDFNGAYDAWLSTLHPDDKKYTDGEIHAALSGEREYEPEFRIILPNGTVRNIKAHSKTFFDAKGLPQRMTGTNIDITDHVKHEAELLHVAQFDALTCIPNRILLADRMKQAIFQTSRDKTMLAICYLDLDGFKPINDSMGHQVGDKVLIEIARRIGNTIRAGDTVARLGGDEFVVLLLGLEKAEECASTLDRLLEAIATPIAVKNMTASVTASIGVSIYPLDDEVSDTLLRHADQAMYIAKQSGKNRFYIYDVDLDKRARGQNDFLKSIRIALEQNQFELYYQPKVNLRSKELVGAEALIRWRHPIRGLLSPDQFLCYVENTDLDIAISEWVTDTALAQIQIWRNSGLDIEVSINISGYHLESKDFVNKLKLQLKKYPDLPFGKLQIEVLETVALNDVTVVQEIIEACREIGVGFALDDFGTGYSSLSYLSALPVDTLKIDQSFIRDMMVDKGDRAIVQGIIALAQAFGRQTVAEGIETNVHFHLLNELGCEIGQGYGIARPMPANELINWKSNYR